MKVILKELNENFDLQCNFAADDYESAQNFADSIMHYLLNKYGVNKTNTEVGQVVHEGTSTNEVVSREVRASDTIDEDLTITSAGGAVFVLEEAAMLASTVDSFVMYVGDELVTNMRQAFEYDYDFSNFTW